MQAYEVPLLQDIFSHIIYDKKKYCFLCLRTEDERGLVSPKSFKQFMEAVNFNAAVEPKNVCHICERQASNALKLFRAAVFASTLNLIRQEIEYRNFRDRNVMFEKKIFEKVVNKVKLGKQLTPVMLEKELEIVRANSFLSETDTLIMDSDEICDESEPKVSTNNPKIKTETAETIILDDDEEQSIPPTITPEPTPRNRSGVLLNPSKNLVVTYETPEMTTLSELASQSNANNFILHPIFLADNGGLKVPSLSAVIINGTLIFIDETKNISHTEPFGGNEEKIKKKLLANNHVFIQHHPVFELPIRIVENLNYNRQNVPKTVTNSNSNGQNRNSNGDEDPLSKKMKLEDGISDKNESWSSNVQISGVSSDVDHIELPKAKAEKNTDWEDKIPMDVISFVDAVDPNANKLLKPVKLEDVRSLAEEKVEPDIIDLC